MRKFTCARCKEEFDTDSMLEEMEDEMRKNCGEIEQSDRLSLCDECYEWALAEALARGLLP